MAEWIKIRIPWFMIRSAKKFFFHEVGVNNRILLPYIASKQSMFHPVHTYLVVNEEYKGKRGIQEEVQKLRRKVFESKRKKYVSSPRQVLASVSRD